jgi:hypothetical protein
MGVLMAAVPSGPNWTPPPTIPIKKNGNQIDPSLCQVCITVLPYLSLNSVMYRLFTAKLVELVVTQQHNKFALSEIVIKIDILGRGVKLVSLGTAATNRPIMSG